MDNSNKKNKKKNKNKNNRNINKLSQKSNNSKLKSKINSKKAKSTSTSNNKTKSNNNGSDATTLPQVSKEHAKLQKYTVKKFKEHPTRSSRAMYLVKRQQSNASRDLNKQFGKDAWRQICCVCDNDPNYKADKSWTKIGGSKPNLPTLPAHKGCRSGVNNFKPKVLKSLELLKKFKKEYEKLEEEASTDDENSNVTKSKPKSISKDKKKDKK